MRFASEWLLPTFAAVLVLVGGFVALSVAPPDRDMGDVYRIMFVHVPAAWVALVAAIVTMVCSVVYMFNNSWKADALAETHGEIVVVFGLLAIVLGSIWGKPTWTTWWTWDPRLTTTAILVFAFAGYLALRQFVDDPERRATWSAVAAIIISADVPIVWFSVKIWGGLHQRQSTIQSVDATMIAVLLVNVVAFSTVYLTFARVRYRLARRRLERELTEPPELEPARGGP